MQAGAHQRPPDQHTTHVRDEAVDWHARGKAKHIGRLRERSPGPAGEPHRRIPVCAWDDSFSVPSGQRGPATGARGRPSRCDDTGHMATQLQFQFQGLGESAFPRTGSIRMHSPAAVQRLPSCDASFRDVNSPIRLDALRGKALPRQTSCMAASPTRPVWLKSGGSAITHIPCCAWPLSLASCAADATADPVLSSRSGRPPYA